MSEFPRFEIFAYIPCFAPRTSAAATCTRVPPLAWPSSAWMPALSAPLPMTVPDARTVTLPCCVFELAKMPCPPRPVTMPSVVMLTLWPP